MPELPEVQTVVNYIKPLCVGKKLVRVKPVWSKVLHNFNEGFNSDFKSNEVRDVYRRAKFIIIAFDDYILAIHLRMTGKLYMKSNKFQSKHITAVFEFEGQDSLYFEDVRKFGRVYLYDDLKVIDSKHGPEPLDSKFSLMHVRDMILHRKRNVKALLLDQSFLSGLGNIYVDESLWKSGIHPNSLASMIPNMKIKALYENIRSTLEDAIEENGTTIIDFSVNGESGRYVNYLSIYGRNKKDCLKCKTKIRKLKVAGRGTYICAKCQKVYGES